MKGYRRVIQKPGQYIAVSADVPEDFLGLDIDFWLNEDVGKVLTRDADGKEVVIVASEDGRRFILKRSNVESLWRHLRLFFFGQSPCGGAIREAKQRLALHNAGISTVPAVVCGELRTGFMHVRSFLVVPMLEGQLLEDHWEIASFERRVELAGKYGELVGNMHEKGFFTALRFKDIIVDEYGEFALIDRECSRPGREFFMWRRSVRCIVRGYRRSVRNLFKIDLSNREASSFLVGLRRGLRTKRKFYRRIRLALINSFYESF